MKVGIVGFAGAGKTTVFNTLTGLQAEVGYGSKDKANLGIIKVPDARIDRLCTVFETQKPYLISRWRWPERFRS